MKIITIVLLLLFSLNSFSQFGSLKKFVTNKTKKTVTKKSEEHVEKQADKAINTAAIHLDTAFAELEAWEDEQFGFVKIKVDENFINPSEIMWQKLRFVTGEDMVYYDRPFNYEKKHKNPKHWNIDPDNKGTVEISDYGVGRMISCAGPGIISPKMKNNSEDYLSDNFTIEFDFLIQLNPFSKPIKLFLYDKVSQKGEGLSQPITISTTSVQYRDSIAKYPALMDNENMTGNWYRLSLSFNNGLMKVFLNEKEMVTYKDAGLNPTGMSLDYNAVPPINIKNLVIAQNPKTIYAQLQDQGKFTSLNIDYDIETERLTGISLSDLSKIAVILIKNPEMKMDIDVYFSKISDHEGTKELGQNKTKYINDILVSMGIEQEQINTVYKGKIMASEINPKSKLSEAVIFSMK
ncbi:MAG: hypothetical protein KAG84_08115 [Bacteroidales bacterium]|nr:hypothetical protein [Bacteroidales bacterium]